MRFIAHIVFGLGSLLMAGAVVLLVLANRNSVSLSLHPLPYEITLPLYLVLALAFIAGLAVGLGIYMTYRLHTGLIIRKQRRQLAAAQLITSSR